MSVCQYCHFIGGYHYPNCRRPQPADAHTALRETAVSCA